METKDQPIAYLLSEIIAKEGPIRVPHNEGHIHQICVDPAHRRQGAGLALIRHAVADFQARCTDRITVAHWAFNTASEALFTKAGFSPVIVTSELGGT